MKDIYRLGVEGHSKIKTAILKSTYRGPFIIIGGAGSLHLRTGKQLCDANGFAYKWPDAHLDYMRARMLDHGQRGFSTFIYLFKWARSNYQNPGWFSWLGRMFAWLFHVFAKKTLTDPDAIGLILCSRIALSMWEGVNDVQWSFLSPPWLLRDKGLRTGRYEIHIDKDEGSEEAGIYGGIYNEDMAVAIVDEVETRKLTHVHWTCTGPIGLKHW
ncbi:hypothetical protein Plec18167_003229 [Paecilomyces lecythidis]|uniref:Uncharacterized protein n=1 Tax=Paecilomyces lecythidis TaxID=3004212 RepID=A0ABR3Y028_9EURO